MPKNTRRITVTRTVTYTTTIDNPGMVDIAHTAADSVTLNKIGGATGATGVMAIAELLAGSDWVHNGTITKGDWSISSKADVEPYITRPKNTALPIGARVVSTNPGKEKLIAQSKLFVVTAIDKTVNDGRTANSNTEPDWSLGHGVETTDGGIKYRTLPKFPNSNQLVAFAEKTAYSIGVVLKPSANSLKEFLVIAATNTNTTTPVWTNWDSTDGLERALTGGGRVICIAGCKTYDYLTQYAVGDLVKPAKDSSQEYLVIVAGKSNTKVLEKTEAATPADVAPGGEIVHGTAKFRRIV